MTGGLKGGGGGGPGGGGGILALSSGVLCKSTKVDIPLLLGIRGDSTAVEILEIVFKALSCVFFSS